MGAVIECNVLKFRRLLLLFPPLYFYTNHNEKSYLPVNEEIALIPIRWTKISSRDTVSNKIHN